MSSENNEHEQIDEYRQGLRSSLTTFLILALGVAAGFGLLLIGPQINYPTVNGAFRSILVAIAPTPGVTLTLMAMFFGAIFTLVIPLALIPRTGEQGRVLE